MRLHRAPTVTALLLAATLTLAACSDDEPREPEPSPTSTGTTAAPTPSPSAEPTEPVLPEAAKEPTEAGARAFITYYWDLINYAQVTGDVKALEKASGPNCAGCNAGITGIRERYAGGSRVVGGEHTVEIQSVTLLTSSSRTTRAFRAEMTARHGEQTVVDSDGSQDERGAGQDQFTVYILWVGARWRLDVMEIK